MPSLDAIKDAALAKAAADKAAAAAAVTAPVSERTGTVAPLTATQIQAAVSKLSSGTPLTDTEKIALGLPTVAAPTAATPVTPAIPVNPVVPVKPVTPVNPVVPVTPVAPVAPAAPTKTAIGTQMVTLNGKQVMITTWSDGTTTQTDYGSTVNQDNAIANLTSMFAAYGLGGDFANAIKDMVIKGYTADTISLIAQDPNSTNPLAIAFQTRFAGNAARIKAGMAPLAPAEYIATERAYRQVMEAAGLPKGFYDSNSDFTAFISKDISPTEIKSRVDAAAESIANADPFYKSSLMSMYGLSTGDMIAHVLDPQMALPLLQKQAEAVKIGTAAARQGWGISATGAENLYTQGVTAAQAAQGFKTVAGMQTDQQRLAEIWGGDAAAQGQNLVAATFGTAGAAYADQQIKALQQKEINAFTGGSGVAKGSLGVSTEQTGGNL